MKRSLLLLAAGWLSGLGIGLNLSCKSPSPTEPAPKRLSISIADVGPLSAKNDNRILFLGVDGATWNVIDPLLNENKLPHIKKLVREGTRGHLWSLPEGWLMSPVVWTTILTGIYHPQEHGITGFEIDGAPPRSYNRKVAALWNMLDEAKTSALVGFWATWPPEELNGIMVSDYLGYRGARGGAEGAENRQLTYPGPFLDEILEVGLIPDRSILRNEFYAKFTKGIVPDPERKRLFGDWLVHYADLYWQDRMFKGIGEYILSEHQPDLTAVYFQGIDAVQHLFWAYYEPEKFEHTSEQDVERYGDIIEKYYRTMDEWIGSLCSLADERTTILIVSDHGAKAKSLQEYRNDRSGQYFHLSGSHQVTGVLIGAGPAIKKGYTIQQARVHDITPTILYLLGLPVAENMMSPENMDGRVLTEMLRSSYLADHPLYTIPAYPRPEVTQNDRTAPELDERATERLRALGYIK